MTKDGSAVDPLLFRSAMGCFLTGVTIVTSADAKSLTGLTANSFTSVSVSPCQVLVCIKSSSMTGAIIRERGLFIVNLLASGQSDLAWRFAKPSDDRFAGLDFILDENGLPHLSGALAHFSCSVDRIHASGDHDVFIGNVHTCQSHAGEPLAFLRGKLHDYQLAPAGG